jgi:8-oxo-dGTP diphosphatase
MEEFKHPRVGVAIAIYNKENKILLGHRIGKHGYDTWSVPGGHLEKYESPINCVIRETLEETGIDLNPYVHLIKEDMFVNNIFFESDRHYITLVYTLFIDEYLEAKIVEPDKCDNWNWFSLGEIPSNLFLPLKNYLNKKHNI